MDDELLSRVQAFKRAHGEFVPPPATDAAVADLVRRCRAELGVEPPDEYLDLLRRSDGLNHDGVFVYDCASTPERRTGWDTAARWGFWQGLVITNLYWRDRPRFRDLLVVGDSDMDLHAWNPASGTWQTIDKVAGEVFDEFATMREMFAEVFRHRI